MAGQEGFTRSEKQVQLVIRILKSYLRCFGDGNGVVGVGGRTEGADKTAIAQMIAKLENYVRRPDPTAAIPAQMNTEL